MMHNILRDKLYRNAVDFHCLLQSIYIPLMEFIKTNVTFLV